MQDFRRARARTQTHPKRWRNGSETAARREAGSDLPAAVRAARIILVPEEMRKLKEASDGGPEAAEKYGAVPGFLGTVAAAASVSAALKKAAAAGAETVRVYCAPDGGGKTEAVLRIGTLPRAEIRHGRIMFAVPKGGFSGRTAAELERAGLPGDRLFPENITEISYGGRTLYSQKP